MLINFGYPIYTSKIDRRISSMVACASPTDQFVPRTVDGCAAGEAINRVPGAN
eukprot:SAG25_NODE_9003_length_392_cov_1.389078_1_plen_53_part_10